MCKIFFCFMGMYIQLGLDVMFTPVIEIEPQGHEHGE